MVSITHYIMMLYHNTSVSGGIANIQGDNSNGYFDYKSSYKHVSNFQSSRKYCLNATHRKELNKVNCIYWLIIYWYNIKQSQTTTVKCRACVSNICALNLNDSRYHWELNTCLYESFTQYSHYYHLQYFFNFFWNTIYEYIFLRIYF